MRKRAFFFLPVVMYAIAAALMGMESMVRTQYQVSPYEQWSVLGWLGFAVLVLAMLVSLGLAVWMVHTANVERDQRELAQGDFSEASRNAWAAAGRWLARH
ncbi:hypothetical protein SAMN05216276_101563 [Streptosporangium subroseum]|uniref:Uncharacterized protein n=1 Tax=Streptosporangium subroseum TaxID=106412 RepID=A0A239H338_9ACTN|nr:hypothetical protein [Streptosporangium subroseum]SNS75565.1 hypothetical protein SAMN05216276_101563 [Streptosporangium subroseum]